MRKTTVYLDDEHAEGLRQLAAATGKSQAELIREGIKSVVGQQSSRTFHSMGKGQGTGSPQRWNAAELYKKTHGGHQQP